MKTSLTLACSLMLTVAALPVVAGQVSTSQSRSIQRTVGDLQVSLVAEAVDAASADSRPSRWVTDAQRVVIETRRGNTVQRLERVGGQDAWYIDGLRRDFDAAAQTWRDRAVEALDGTWEVARLESQIASERRAISRLRMSASRVYTPVDPAMLEVDTAIKRLDRVRIDTELSDHEFAIARMERDIRAHDAAFTRLAAAIAALRSLSASSVDPATTSGR